MTKKKVKHKLGLEEELSEERTILANERTLLSYVRTAFAVIVAGIAIIGFFKGGFLNAVGFVVLFSGIIFFVAGIIYYFVRKKKIEKEY